MSFYDDECKDSLKKGPIYGSAHWYFCCRFQKVYLIKSIILDTIPFS